MFNVARNPVTNRHGRGDTPLPGKNQDGMNTHDKR
jgi:hypothetical protein